MVFDKRSRRGAVAVSAGLLLGAFNLAAVANATPDGAADPESTSSAGSATTHRTAGSTGRLSEKSKSRATAPARRGGSYRVAPAADAEAFRSSEATPVLPDRLPGAGLFSAPRGTNRSVPQAVSPVPAGSPALHVGIPAAIPRPPGNLSAAGSSVAVGSRGGGPRLPLPAAATWTMLAFARSEIERRSGAAASQPVGQTVSPLGTAEQIAGEVMAMRTAQTLPMLAMKAVLGLAWRVIGAIDYAAVGGPDAQNLAALRTAVDEWAMGAAFQSMILNSNDPSIVMQVAPPHRWYGEDVTGSRILYDNPDTIYRFVGVNYASEYVITGHLPENDPRANFSVLTGTTGTTVRVLDADQLELGPDRTFVLTVSGTPADPGQKNHLQITPDTTLIAIRDTLSDWNTQEPMALAIHRTAGPPNSLFSQFGGFAILGRLVSQSPLLTAVVSLVPPLPAVPPIVRGSIAALLMIRGIPEEAKYIKVATTDSVTGKPKAPNVFTDPTSNASFLATQLQSAGYFQLTDDEALVLTITPNRAGYFVAPVTNDWTITNNYWDEQTSLNSTQAKSNADGSFTIVVSPSEPRLSGESSVWNWVSTGGLHQGTMAIRFQSLDPGNPVGPAVTSQVVSLRDLASVLPVGTAVVTPVGRAAQIAARSEGFNRRFAPYPQT